MIHLLTIILSIFPIFKILSIYTLLSFSKSLAKNSKHTKCIFLNNQPCTTILTLAHLNLDENNQKSIYYPFI